jgi:hypothetical protein
MAHFAEIDENNIVKQVIVVHDNELLEEGIESESKGIAFCQSLYDGNWVQTSYNATFRKNFAGIGFFYDISRDAFIPTKRFPSWIIDEESCIWKPPIPYPQDGFDYDWVEETVSWSKVLHKKI